MLKTVQINIKFVFLTVLYPHVFANPYVFSCGKTKREICEESGHSLTVMQVKEDFDHCTKKQHKG